MKAFNPSKILKQWTPLIRYFLLIAVILYVGYLLWRHLQDADLSKLNIPIYWILLSGLCEVLARCFIGLGYHCLLNCFKANVRLGSAVSIAWVSFLGRYLPGKIALIGSAFYLLKRQNVSVVVAGAVPVLSTLITILVALILSVPLIPAANEFNRLVLFCIGMVFLAVLFIILMKNKSCLEGILKLNTLKQTGYRLSISVITILSAIVLFQCISAGASTWVLSQAYCPTGLESLGWFVSVTAFSGVMGLIAFFSPAGIGVRDGFYLMLLGQVVGMENAAFITIMLRIVQTAVDMVTALIGFIYLKLNNHV